MALACKCDRCKKFFLPDDEGRCTKMLYGEYSLENSLNGLNWKVEIDLCPECLEILKKWLYDNKEVKS